MEPLQNIKLSFKCPKQLNQLQPCNGDWYCDGCRKIVYDFRGMTEAQVMTSLVKNNYKMCGIFEAGRIEVMPQQKRWSRWASAAMLALGLTGLHKNVYAQTSKPADTSSTKKTNPLVLGKTYIGGSVEKAVQNLPPEALTQIVFGGVGYEPEFPGGEVALKKFLYQHLKYDGEYSGRTFVQFFVEKDGSLTDIKMLRGTTKELDLQIINILKHSPKWKPAIQNGKPYRVQYTLPVKIGLEE